MFGITPTLCYGWGNDVWGINVWISVIQEKDVVPYLAQKFFTNQEDKQRLIGKV